MPTSRSGAALRERRHSRPRGAKACRSGRLDQIPLDGSDASGRIAQTSGPQRTKERRRGRVDPGLLDAIGKLSAAALLAGAVIALATRLVYTRGEVRDRDTVWKERFEELRRDRDSWKSIAETLLPKVDRLTDIVVG